MEFWEDYELLRVETPENLELALPLAGFGPRFLAFFIDNLIITVIQVILAFVVMMAFFGAFATRTTPPDWAIIILVVVFIVLIFFAPVFYFIAFESRWNGQSPGKRMAGVRVIRRGGFPIGPREIVWRNVLRIVDMLPSNWMAGVISFFATKYQQRLGDLVADTVVIREFTSARPYAWAVSSSSTASPRLAANVGSDASKGVITPALSYIIGSYLQRAPQLSDYWREELSRRCIQALGYDPAGLTVLEREGYLLSVLQASWESQS